MSCFENFLIYYILGTKMVPKKGANIEMLSDLMKTKLFLSDGFESAQHLLNKIGYQNSPSQPLTPGIL